MLQAMHCRQKQVGETFSQEVSYKYSIIFLISENQLEKASHALVEEPFSKRLRLFPLYPVLQHLPRLAADVLVKQVYHPSPLTLHLAIPRTAMQIQAKQRVELRGQSCLSEEGVGWIGQMAI